MLKPGDLAPDFTLQSDRGSAVRLSNFRDKPVVLLFYPKDDTPGCTLECKEFSQARSKFEGKAHVFGISADDVKSHQAFRDKHGLNIPLLADTDHKVCMAYGVWGPTRWGEGITRMTFIIGRDGRIQEIFPNVNPEGHAEAVLRAL